MKLTLYTLWDDDSHALKQSNLHGLRKYPLLFAFCNAGNEDNSSSNAILRDFLTRISG